MLDRAERKSEAKKILRNVVSDLYAKAEEVYPHHERADYGGEEWRAVIGQRSAWVEARLENLVTKLSGMAQTGVFDDGSGGLVQAKGREYP